MFGLTKKEEEVFRKLNTPKKIQNFINKIPINFDYKKDTCMSPRLVLRKNKCHCIEGAILAALALRLQGKKPLVVDLTAADFDYDHVIAVFQEKNEKGKKKWGAITKTNHGVLRYREPVYSNIRELVMSFFHEYFDDKGRKTLRSYSNPVDLSRFDKSNWATSEEEVWFIPNYLVKTRHFKILDRKQIRNLRKADKIEIKIGKVTEWKYQKNKEERKFKYNLIL
jgi:hypothetical protein